MNTKQQEEITIVNIVEFLTKELTENSQSKLVETRTGITKELLFPRITIEPSMINKMFDITSLAIGRIAAYKFFGKTEAFDEFRKFSGIRLREYIYDNYSYDINDFVVSNWIDKVMAELKNKNTRRAIASFTSTNCTYSVQFLIRQNRLFTVISSRSIDIYKKFIVDFSCFAQIHTMIAKELNVEPAIIVWNIVSLHIHVDDIEQAKQIKSKSSIIDVDEITECKIQDDIFEELSKYYEIL